MAENSALLSPTNMFHWPGMFVSNLPMGPGGTACGVPVADVPPCKQGTPSWKRCRGESWRAMLQLQSAGKVRALGTSNFEVAQLQELLDATPPASSGALALNQVESHIGYHDDFLQAWCRAHGVQQQAYSPLGHGQLAKSTQPAVLAAAARHNVSTAQVALRFLVQSGLSAVPKAASPKYQLENRDVFRWALDADEMVALGALANPCADPALRPLPLSGEAPATDAHRYERGVGDGASMMCVEPATGYMARCSYLDA